MKSFSSNLHGPRARTQNGLPNGAILNPEWMLTWKKHFLRLCFRSMMGKDLSLCFPLPVCFVILILVLRWCMAYSPWKSPLEEAKCRWNMPLSAELSLQHHQFSYCDNRIILPLLWLYKHLSPSFIMSWCICMLHSLTSHYLLSKLSIQFRNSKLQSCTYSFISEIDKRLRKELKSRSLLLAVVVALLTTREMWFFSHKIRQLMTHVWSKLCGFVHYKCTICDV